MIQENSVVLISGAGATAPYDFPSGEGLGNLIKGIGQQNVTAFLKKLPTYTADHVNQFLEDFRTSGWTSIDRFLQHRTEYSNIGRTMIAYQLMKTERPAVLFDSSQNRWYTYFFNNILNPKSPVEFNNNQLRMITYNYDRSMEAFLFNTLRSGFALSDEEAAERVGSIPIVHVHGSFGDLPGMGTDIREYRGDLIGLEQAIHRLNIVSDDIEKSGVLEKCGQLLQGASHVVFLGFGFDPVNLGRLHLETNCPDAQFSCAAFGLVDSEVDHIIKPYFSSRQLNIAYPNPKWDCLNFLRNNRDIFV